jgi:hypothetical protein
LPGPASPCSAWSGSPAAEDLGRRAQEVPAQQQPVAAREAGGRVDEPERLAEQLR